mgnify:CR=1 FL=1
MYGKIDCPPFYFEREYLVIHGEDKRSLPFASAKGESEKQTFPQEYSGF